MLVKRVLAVLLVAATLPYFRAPIYDFPPPRPFSGVAWYNPYERSTGAWLMGNLHAHGWTWMGLTNGRQSNDEVVRAYRAVGYDIAVVSDYMFIASQAGVPSLPAYEHGYNLAKSHQLVLGAKRVEWIDFPFVQGRSQKQYVLDRLRQSAAFIALVHPSARYSYSIEDLQSLTGFQAIEVLSGPFSAEEHWDAALSSGRVVWGLGDDDTHDVTDPRRMGVSWNMIDARSAADGDVLAALEAGRSYAVGDSSGRNGHRGGAVVERVTVAGGALTVSWRGAPGTISFVRQNGETRATVEHVLSGSYALASDDQYVRSVIRTADTLIYLNPVIRWDGTRLPAPVATVNLRSTWLAWILLAAACAAVVRLLWRRTR